MREDWKAEMVRLKCWQVRREKDKQAGQGGKGEEVEQAGGRVRGRGLDKAASLGAAGAAAPARDDVAQPPAAHRGMQVLPEAAGLLAEEPDPLSHPLHAVGDVFVVVQSDAQNFLGFSTRPPSPSSPKGLDYVLNACGGAQE